MKKYIAEFLGTFMLVFVGTGAVVISGAGSNSITGIANVLAVGLAFGLTITIMAYTFGGISGGNFNPAVSLAMMLNKRLSVKDGIFYIISQFLGATVAAGFVGLMADAAGFTGLGATDFPTITAPMALLFEAVITFIFVLVILMTTSEKYGNSTMAPIAIGITLSLLIAVALNLTGGSLNPARSFGPAIFNGGSPLSDYWVYLVAPLLGGAIAAYVAKFMGSEEAVVVTKPAVKKATPKKATTAAKKTTTRKTTTAKATPKKTTATKKATTKKADTTK